MNIQCSNSLLTVLAHLGYDYQSFILITGNFVAHFCGINIAELLPVIAVGSWQFTVYILPDLKPEISSVFFRVLRETPGAF